MELKTTCTVSLELGGGGKSYHKLKIQTDIKGNMFVKLHGYRLFLDEFIRTGKEQTKLWEQ